MASPEAQNMLQIAKADLETAIASSDPTIFRETALLKLLLEQNVEIAKFLELDQLTDYPVQFRYDAESTPLGLDRIALNHQMQALIDQVEAVVTGSTKS